MDILAKIAGLIVWVARRPGEYKPEDHSQDRLANCTNLVYQAGIRPNYLLINELVSPSVESLTTWAQLQNGPGPPIQKHASQ